MGKGHALVALLFVPTHMGHSPVCRDCHGFRVHLKWCHRWALVSVWSNLSILQRELAFIDSNGGSAIGRGDLIDSR
jgi:hypothetical protein